MRILIFSNAYKPAVSGVVTSITHFRQGLIEAGHEVHIIAPEYGDYQDEEPYIFRVPSIDLTSQLGISLPIPFKVWIETTVRGIRPEVIHSQHPVVLGDLAAVISRDLQVPLVFTFHSRYEEYAQKYVPLMPEFAGLVTEEVVSGFLENCTHIVAPTPSIRDLIHQKYEVDVPVSVVPTPVDLNQYQSLEPQRIRTSLRLEGTEVLLYVGRLAEEKNLNFLLTAFARIIHQRPQVRLLLVGSGPKEKALKRLVKKKQLIGKVIFAGPIPHSEVPHYVASADLFVFPSETETQGLVLAEAMAAGTPVVAVDAPSSADVLKSGGGLLVPAREEDFAEVVLGLLADKPQLRELSEQAKRVAQQYSISAASACLLKVYQAAIAAGPRPVKKALALSRGRGIVVETWRESIKQFQAIGDKLSTAFHSARRAEDEQQYLQTMRHGLEEMINNIDRATHSAKNSVDDH